MPEIAGRFFRAGHTEYLRHRSAGPAETICIFLIFIYRAHLMSKPRRTVNAPLFIFLEYITGLGFGLLGVNIYSYLDTTSKLFDYMLKVYLVEMAATILGVGLIAFLHYRTIH